MTKYALLHKIVSYKKVISELEKAVLFSSNIASIRLFTRYHKSFFFHFDKLDGLALKYLYFVDPGK